MDSPEKSPQMPQPPRREAEKQAVGEGSNLALGESRGFSGRGSSGGDGEARDEALSRLGVQAEARAAITARHEAELEAMSKATARAVVEARPHLTMSEIAAALGVSRQRLYQLIRPRAS